MIKCLLDTNPRIFLKLFNCILNKNPTINKWMTSILNPIHKTGNKAEPSNYRGISIMSCLGKFFNSILNLRLTNYVLENKILKDTQLGFRKGNRTTDAHIILHSLIQEYCYKNSQKLYGCFVDFKKAFDTIPRGLLFEKLLNHGIKGKFFNVLKTMYTNAGRGHRGCASRLPYEIRLASRLPYQILVCIPPPLSTYHFPS